MAKKVSYIPPRNKFLGRARRLKAKGLSQKLVVFTCMSEAVASSYRYVELIQLRKFWSAAMLQVMSKGTYAPQHFCNYLNKPSNYNSKVCREIYDTITSVFV